MKIHFGKKTVQMEVRKMGFWGKFLGLMFKSKNTRSLLFEFKPAEPSAIHSFFVFFPFLAIWLDKKNNLLEWNLVNPFTLAVIPKERPAKLVEVPLNSKNRKIFDLLVGKGKHLNIQKNKITDSKGGEQWEKLL